MSRSDAGDVEVTLVDVSLPELVQRSLPPAARSALAVSPGARDVVVRVDKRRFERVVTNLVDNAEHHGGGLRAVTVTRAGSTAHLWVDDAGPGVPDVDRERIFERFARASAVEADGTTGVGLGLALVAGHLQLVGGRVWVEDLPAGGARFVVELPVHQG